MNPINKPILLLLVFLVIKQPSYSQEQIAPMSNGFKITIHSKVLDEDRTLFVSLPKSYEEFPGAEYPVLYTSDGAGFFPMVAGQVHFLSENFRIIPRMIVVCIDNPQRGRDLVPPGVGRRRPENDSIPSNRPRMTPGGDLYQQMIREDIIPYIESHYSTTPYRIFLGHSLGGLTAFNSMLKFPDIFNAYIAISPSLQFGNGWAIDLADSVLKQSSVFQKLLFFSDGNEGDSFHGYQLKMDSLLKEKTLENFEYSYVHYENETHLSEPVKAFYDGLRFIYPNWYPSYDNKEPDSYDVILHHYTQLSDRYGYLITPPEKMMDDFARKLAEKVEDLDIALTILKNNTTNYPKSYHAYESLADVLRNKGEEKDAIRNYKMALSLKPDSEEIQNKIKAGK